MKKNNLFHQTPPHIAEHMAILLSWLDIPLNSILEPHPGAGNLVDALKKWYDESKIKTYRSFEAIPKTKRFDAIVMNPPFDNTGWIHLQHCLTKSKNIICLLPWSLLLNSENTINILLKFGLKRIIHLPRNSFTNRVQCCIVVLKKGYQGETRYSLYKPPKK